MKENNYLVDSQQRPAFILGPKARKYIKILESANQEMTIEMAKLQEEIGRLTTENQRLKTKREPKEKGEQEIAKEAKKLDIPEESIIRDKAIKQGLERIKEMAQKITEEQEAIDQGYYKQKPEEARAYRMKKAELIAYLIGLVSAYRDSLPADQFDRIQLESGQSVPEFLNIELEKMKKLWGGVGEFENMYIPGGKTDVISKTLSDKMYNAYMSIIPKGWLVSGDIMHDKDRIQYYDSRYPNERGLDLKYKKHLFMDGLLDGIVSGKEKTYGWESSLSVRGYLPRTAEKRWDPTVIENKMGEGMKLVADVTKDDRDR